MINSFGVGVVMSLLVTVALRNLPPSSAMIASEMSRLLLFMSFTLGFFISLLVLMRRLPPNWWQLANEIAKAEKYEAPKEKWGGTLNGKKSGDYAPLFDTTLPKGKKDKLPATLATNEDDAPFGDAPKAADENNDASADTEAAPAALMSDAINSTADQSVDAVAQAKAQASAEIDKFVQSMSVTMQSAARTLDALTRFAMQLYLAGACSSAARKFALSATDAFSLMIHGLMQSGIGKAFSESFALNVEEYAQRETYRGVTKAGQTAMETQLRGEAGAVAAIVATLDQWAEAKPAAPRVVTFMFTDIVDAAALSQRLGNLHTQRVIKAHDEVVREAIAQNKGTEIQHTGDGVIATYPDPARAVAAAQVIQQKLDDHNKRNAHLSANVRIAINAGEAVEEAGTFFGATVKMAAKVCAMGKAGQILAPDVIKSFCKTSQHLFKPYGDITVEELGKTRAVYEISWMKSGQGLEYGDIGRPSA